MALYETAVRPLLFRLDPERAHDLAVRASELSGRSAVARRAVRRALRVRDPRLRTTFAGLELENPLGLAAGFDKNGRAVRLLGTLGFGHLEIGSVSARPSDGNPRPRLFPPPQDGAIVVSYGVPNDGAEVVRERLAGPRPPVALGVNLVKTNDPARPAVAPGVYEDYARSFAALQDRADYVALNLSCPNSAADRDFFDDLPRIGALLDRLAACGPRVPVILKLKPTRDAGRWCPGFPLPPPAGRPADRELSAPGGALDGMPGAVGGKPVQAYVDA